MRKPKLAIYARTSVDKDEFTSSIDQQIAEGKKFAIENNFEYEIFKDIGVSAYKIEDEKDPYYTREEFKKLMDKINRNVFTDLWVWETSRLSRNDLATAKIKNSLLVHNVILHTKTQSFDLTNPEEKFQLSIMADFAEYERSLIVKRTTRGLYKAINEGRRSFSNFYGYTKGNKKGKNYEYFVNELELDNVRKAYEMIKQGKTLREISLSLIDEKPTQKNDILKISTKWGRILRHKEYTGFSLNLEGLEIEHKFENGEIKTLNALLDVNKYWVESKVYTEKIITIEDWIRIREKLQVQKFIQADYKKNYSVKTLLATGLITCNCCGLKYFKYAMKSTKKGKILDYYKHSSLFNNEKCSQHPKTIRATKIDYILGFFYFYYILIFDTSNHRQEKAIKEYKQNKKIYENQLSKNEKLLKDIEKALQKIKSIMLNDNDSIDIQLQLYKDFSNQKKEAEIKVEESTKELAKLELKYSDSMVKKEFKKIFDDWEAFYFKESTEGNRARIIEVLAKNPEGNIKNGITIFSNYLVIQTDNNTFFVFKIDTNYKSKDSSKDPYYRLPLHYLTENNKPKFFSVYNEIWQRFQSGKLDYENPETQEYLKNKFQWKTFIVSNENIELDVKIPFPENSKVIYFDESIDEDEKKLKDRERKRKWAEKKKLEKLNSIK